MGIANYIPFNAIYWSVYENAKKAMPESSDTQKAIVGAGLAITCGSGFIHPLDLVKTRYQVATSNTVANVASSVVTRNSDKDGVRQIIRNVLRESGVA